MKISLMIAAAFSVGMVAFAEDKPKEKPMSGPLQFKMKDIEEKEVDLAQYKGKVVLFVNVASQCGYTKQYKTLQELYEKFEKEGLVVVGVPANEFGSQEPGTNAEISKFCKTTYKVGFPMMAKVVVKGEDKTPLYKFLTEKETNPKFAGEIGWNFEKFLIGRNGEVVGRYKSSVDPMSDAMLEAVKKELAAK